MPPPQATTMRRHVDIGAHQRKMTAPRTITQKQSRRTVMTEHTCGAKIASVVRVGFGVRGDEQDDCTWKV